MLSWRGIPRRPGWLVCLPAFCLLCGLLFWPAVTRAGTASVRVVRVLDGDTCQLSDGRRLRLAGIDTPEKAHDAAPAQYFAAAATLRLSRLTEGNALRLVVVGEGKDRFDRTLGDLLLPDGKSVAESLLEEGAAFFFWFSDLPRDTEERLLAAQRRAMAAGRGFWPRILSLPTGPLVGNTASRRFHDARCHEAVRISPRNRVAFASLAEAFGQGFSPARECTPWPRAAAHPEERARNRNEP